MKRNERRGERERAHGNSKLKGLVDGEAGKKTKGGRDRPGVPLRTRRACGHCHRSGHQPVGARESGGVALRVRDGADDGGLTGTTSRTPIIAAAVDEERRWWWLRKKKRRLKTSLVLVVAATAGCRPKAGTQIHRRRPWYLDDPENLGLCGQYFKGTNFIRLVCIDRQRLGWRYGTSALHARCTKGPK